MAGTSGTVSKHEHDRTSEFEPAMDTKFVAGMGDDQRSFHGHHLPLPYIECL
jgi:hypothetical protein